MIPLASNAEDVRDGLGRLQKRSNHNCLCLLLAVALLCLNPVLSAQQMQISYPLIPKFQLLGWLYAPPGGPSSFVSYGGSTAVGSSHSQSFTSSNAQTQTNTTTSGFSLFGFGSQTQNTVSDQWTTQTQSGSSISITTTNSNSLEVLGPPAFVGVSHDYDLAVLQFNPVINTTLTYNPNAVPIFSFLWNGFEYNSCELGNPSDPVNFYQLISGCDPIQGLQPDIILMPVACLKTPYSQAKLQMSPATCVEWWQEAGQKLSVSRYWDQSSWGVDSKTGAANGPMMTVQDFANVLRGNPFVTQVLVADNYQKDGTGAAENPYTSPCHPTYGLDFNPDESETIPDSSTFSAPFSGTWPKDFCGTPGTTMAREDEQPTVVHYQSSVNNGASVTRQVQSSLSTMATDTYVHSVNATTTSSFDFSASIGIPLATGVPLSSSLFSDGFNFSTSSGTGNSWTDVQSWSNTNTTGSTSTAGWSITGPSPTDNYAGPTTFNVYADNVYGTFAFWSPLTLQNLPALPTSSPIKVAMATAGTVTCGTTTTCNFGKVTVGKTSGAIPVTLTNETKYQLTMQSPSLSFSDVAPDASSNDAQVSSFVIVAGSDLCAGKVLAPGGSCTVKIAFKPRLGDAPNAEHASYPVNAYLMAAGTEGIPFFTGGTCQTSYCSNVLVTNTVIKVTAPGAESFTRVMGTALPAAATCTGIKPSCDVGATLTPATLDFPTNATSGTQVYTFKNWASVSSPVSSVELSDTTDYSITSDACSGHTLASLATCTFTLVYSAKGTGALNTEVSVVQTVSGATTTLASAGAAAIAPPPPPPPQINDTQQTNYTCTYLPPPPYQGPPILAYTVYGYVNWSFSDSNQVVHPFNVSTSNWNGETVANTNCSIVPVVDLTASGTATDGSGYTISIINAVQATVTSPSGQKWKNY
jgi:hypothetical protein